MQYDNMVCDIPTPILEPCQLFSYVFGTTPPRHLSCSDWIIWCHSYFTSTARVISDVSVAPRGNGNDCGRSNRGNNPDQLGRLHSLSLLSSLVICHPLLHHNQILGVTCRCVVPKHVTLLAPGPWRWVLILVSHSGGGGCIRFRTWHTSLNLINAIQQVCEVVCQCAKEIALTNCRSEVKVAVAHITATFSTSGGLC